MRGGPLLRRLGLELGRAVPGRDIDLRWLDELPAAIRGRVVTEGCLVHEFLAGDLEDLRAYIAAILSSFPGPGNE